MVSHLLWLSISDLLFYRRLEPTALMNLLSANSTSQAQATARVGADFQWVSVYFATLLCASYAIPKLLRSLISKYRLDRDAAPFSSIFRFHEAPWYYLLTPADFEMHDEPDFIVISAIVDVAGAAVLYVGVLDEFFVNSDGQLDRLVLQEVMRRPIAADKTPATPDDGPVPPRFYDIDGDYFVLRYSEAITLNVRYVKLIPVESAAMEAGLTASANPAA
ncbi:MAG: hypothetical protein JWQ01_2789 [Massilia sp.]|nr:hypothetical protein [Massilia sp.]